MSNKQKVLFKKRWKESVPNAFVEYGFDRDNNKKLFGVSSEIELDDSTEFRIKGAIPLNSKEYYIRIWIGRLVFSIGTGELELVLKKRKCFKFVFGVAGRICLKTAGEIYEKYGIVMSDKKQ